LVRPATAGDPPPSFAQMIRKAGPAVVNLIVAKRARPTAPGRSPYELEEPFQDFFERFFRDRLPREYKEGTLGSGFIIDPSGLILTNNHVVENASALKVRLSDDREYPGEIVGRDAKTDLALIRIKAGRPLASLPLGDSDALQVGDWVVAIGNPFGLGNTVTSGIVSAKYRQLGAGAYTNFIQTDAAINPGNSGGPLLNLDGQVVGINSAIFSQTGSNVGIGFAIPINMAKELLPQLRQGKVRRSYLGVVVQDITPELKQSLKLTTDRGALVSDVIPGTASAKAGVKRGDVIIFFDGKEIRNSRELPYIVAGVPIGKKCVLEALRDGQPVRLGVITEEAKADEPSEGPDFGSQLGLSLQDLTPDIAKSFALSRTRGVLVTQVDEDSPGLEAGLAPGDIIIEADRKTIADVAALNRILDRSSPGKPVLLLVDRDGRTIYITIGP
jgi:serine protease Do